MKPIPQLHVPRIEDLPYHSSPPVQFVYESTVTLGALIPGTYKWADQPSPLTVLRPLQDNGFYLFRNVTITASIAEGDYVTNISTTPLFNMYTLADSKAVLFREPIYCNKYYQQFDYRLLWTRARADNQLLAAFTGLLVQGPALIGVTTITLKAVIAAQEITDNSFTHQIRHMEAANMETLGGVQ